MSKKQKLDGPAAGAVTLLFFIFAFVFAMYIYNTTTIQNTLPTQASIPTQSATIAPTNTLTPDETLYNIVDDNIAMPLLEARTNPDVPSVLIRYEMLENNLNVALYQIEQMFCPIRDSGLFPDYRYLIRARGQFVDAFGNPVDQDGLTIRLMPDAINNVNCENITSVNWQAIADLYEVHQLITE